MKKILSMFLVCIVLVAYSQPCFAVTGVTGKVTIGPVSSSEDDEAPIAKKGSKGNIVKEIQEHLIELGYLQGKADGDYGKKTEEAVKSFQSASQLEPTGIVDATTYELLSTPDSSSVRDDAVTIETDYDNIVQKIPGFATYNTVLVSDPKVTDDLIAYTVGINESRFGILTNAVPENKNVLTLMAVPISVDEDAAADILDFYCYLIRAIDSSVDSYHGYSLWSSIMEEGHVKNNGVDYLYEESKHTFFALIPR